MSTPTDPRIISADRVEHGLIVAFSDGTSAVYDTQFLYSAREYGDNYLVEADEEDED
ncbi:MAG: hypothetical protein ACR2JE_11725 [Acidobacteriaceae bacterium]